MKNILVGRENEIKTLQNALDSGKPEFIAVIGRRRVGKTFLVKQTYGLQIDFELTGLQKAKKGEQIQNFVFALSTYFPDYELEEKPKTWLEAFFNLSKALEKNRSHHTEKQIIFLDELPWLGTKRSGFLTGLAWFWNTWASNNPVVLVICGSAASWMIEKVIQDRGGLHNRVTQILHLHPFTLLETEKFFQAKHITLNRYHIVQLYMVMGGIPMYLDQVKPGLSAIQNIQEVCFGRNGYLRNEFDRLFSSLFNNYERHVEIIRILASKRMGMTRQEIIKKSRLKNGGMLSKTIEELSQSGFVEIYRGYGKKSKQSLIRLIDPYSLFYLTFLEPMGKNAKTDFRKLSDLPHYKSWSGYAFENVCLIHIDQIRKALGISGIFTSVSSFYARRSESVPGAQIDLVIDRGDQAISIVEIKFSQSVYAFTKQEGERLLSKKEAFTSNTKTKKHIFQVLLTTFGVKDSVAKDQYIDHALSMEELFT